MIEIKLDSTQIEDMVASVAERVIAKQQEQQHHLPIVLSKERLCEELDISTSTATTLFRRADFPVARNLGGPKVVTHLLLQWLEREAGWVEKNAGPKRRLG